MFGGLGPDGYVLVNSERDIDELGLAELRDRHRRERIATVPATALARARTGRPIPNAALLGALAALTGIVSLDALTKAIGERFSGAAATGNAAAARDTFDHVRERAHA